MPCRSDYLEPNEVEIESSKVLALLDELITGKLPDYFGNGMYHKVYSNFTQKDLDEKTKLLCNKLQKIEVNKYSLEMQLWWRDHQKADKRHLEKELQRQKDDDAKKKALSKLTDYERGLLGL